jgi:hypothetical protein
MSKKKDICDELEWFVDCLGTTDFLEMILDQYDAGKLTVLSRRGGRSSAPSGLIFDGAHWVYKDKDGTIYNSYNLKHQIRGTAHFCQTFALMYALQHSSNLKTNLRRGDYAYNIKIATLFWRRLFKAHPKFFRFFMGEVRTWSRLGEQNKSDPAYKPGRFVPQIESIAKPLSKYTQNDIIKYTKWVEKNAEYFKGCKEG